MRIGLAVAMAALMGGSDASAQSELPSAISALSVAPSVVAVELSLAAVEGSATLVVTGVRGSGELLVVVLGSAVTGASVTLEIAGELAAGLSLAVGTVVVATATVGGWLLSVGGEAIAFVPNEGARVLIHHRELAH